MLRYRNFLFLSIVWVGLTAHGQAVQSPNRLLQVELFQPAPAVDLVRITPKSSEVVPIYVLPGYNAASCAADRLCKITGWVEKGKPAKVNLIVNRNVGGRSLDYLEVSVEGKVGYIDARQTDYSLRLNELPPQVPKRLSTENVNVPKDVTVAQGTDPGCTNCVTHPPTLLEKISSLRRIFDYFHEVYPSISFGDGKAFNRSCRNFMDEKGHVGRWGERMLRAIKAVDKQYAERNNGRSCFFQDMKMGNMCPNFMNLSQSQKEKLWVYWSMSVAQYESECQLSAINPNGTNTTAVGLFQLEKSLKFRAGRDVNFCKSKSNIGIVSLQSISFQTECTASILADFNCENNKLLYATDGYWEVHRGIRSKSAKLIAKFPGCALQPQKTKANQ